MPTDGRFRDIIDTRSFALLSTNPTFDLKDFGIVPEQYRKLAPEYIKEYVSLNQFADQETPTPSSE